MPDKSPKPPQAIKAVKAVEAVGPESKTRVGIQSVEVGFALLDDGGGKIAVS